MHILIHFINFYLIRNIAVNSHNMTGLCAYLLGRIRSEMLVNGTSLFFCCLCLWGFRDFVGDDRNSCSNPYMEVSSEMALLLGFCVRVSLLQGFPHIYYSSLLLGFCFLVMYSVIYTICGF